MIVTLSWRLILSAKTGETVRSTYLSLASLADLPDDPEQTSPYPKLAGTWEATATQRLEANSAGDILTEALRRMHGLGSGWLTTECGFANNGALNCFGAIFDARQFSRAAHSKLVWCSLDVLPEADSKLPEQRLA